MGPRRGGHFSGLRLAMTFPVTGPKSGAEEGALQTWEGDGPEPQGRGVGHSFRAKPERPRTHSKLPASVCVCV